MDSTTVSTPNALGVVENDIPGAFPTTPADSLMNSMEHKKSLHNAGTPQQYFPSNDTAVSQVSDETQRSAHGYTDSAIELPESLELRSHERISGKPVQDNSVASVGGLDRDTIASMRPVDETRPAVEPLESTASANYTTHRENPASDSALVESAQGPMVVDNTPTDRFANFTRSHSPSPSQNISQSTASAPVDTSQSISPKDTHLAARETFLDSSGSNKSPNATAAPPYWGDLDDPASKTVYNTVIGKGSDEDTTAQHRQVPPPQGIPHDGDSHIPFGMGVYNGVMGHGAEESEQKLRPRGDVGQTGLPAKSTEAVKSINLDSATDEAGHAERSFPLSSNPVNVEKVLASEQNPTHTVAPTTVPHEPRQAPESQVRKEPTDFHTKRSVSRERKSEDESIDSHPSRTSSDGGSKKHHGITGLFHRHKKSEKDGSENDEESMEKGSPKSSKILGIIPRHRHSVSREAEDQQRIE